MEEDERTKGWRREAGLRNCSWGSTERDIHRQEEIQTHRQGLAGRLAIH